MSLRAISIYDPISFPQRIKQNSEIKLEEGEQIIIEGCREQDLIFLKNGLPSPHDLDQKITDQEKVRQKIFIILDKFLLGISYRCRNLTSIQKVAVDFSKRQFSLEGPFSFEAEVIPEDLELFSLIDLLCRVPIGTYMHFPYGVTVLITGFTPKDTEILNESDHETIPIRLSRIVKSRFKNLGNTGLNFLIGPFDKIDGVVGIRTVQFSKQVYVEIISTDRSQGIHMALLTNEEFERASNQKSETLSSQEEITSRL